MSNHQNIKVFLSGAGGNIGTALLAAAQTAGMAGCLVADLREGKEPPMKTGVVSRNFDFLDPGTFNEALRDCTVLFLVRPLQISGAVLFYPVPSR